MKISEQPPNLRVYVCRHVFDQSRTMYHVHVHHDGDLQIICGGHDHDFSKGEEVHVVGLGHLTAYDPSLLSIPELDPGASAQRETPTAPWKISGGN